MIIFTDNRIDNSTLSATNENANFPIENIQNVHLVNRFRTSAASTVITVTFTSQYNIDSICIGGHNLTSQASITVEYLQGGSYSTLGTVSAELENTTDNLLLNTGFNLLLNSGDLLLLNGSTRSNPYGTFDKVYADGLRITISDTANTDGYIEIGRIYAGEYYETNKIGGAPVEDRNSTTKYNISVTGQAYRVTGYQYDTIEYFVPQISIEELEEIRGKFDDFASQGPFFIVPYDSCSGITPQARYVIYNNASFEPIFRQGGIIFYQARFPFREAF